MSVLEHRVLVAELGLHGEGEADYYTGIVSKLWDDWSGWPKLAVKVQLWTDPDAPWARMVQETHGRPPLPSLSAEGLAKLADFCRMAEIYLGATAHDVGAVDVIVATSSIGYIKVAGCQCQDTELLNAVSKTSLPIVVSIPKRLWASAPPRRGSSSIRLQAHDAYPANKPFVRIEGQSWGYSCHSLPSFAMQHCFDAARQSARMIEVHVTARGKTLRPMPGDYSVSLQVPEFITLARRIKNVWSARVAEDRAGDD